MYFITRALAYLRKQKAKTLLLLVLFFVIGNIVLAGLSVQSAADAAKILTRQEIGTDITYSLNYQQFMQDERSGLLSADTETSSLEGVPLYANLLAIADSDYVSAYDAILSYEVTSDSLTPYTYISTSTDTSQPSDPNRPSDGKMGQFVSGTYGTSGDFSFKTFTATTPTDFTDGTSTLSEGRYATADEIANGSLVAIIESTMAEENNLKVGDSFTVTPTMEGYTDQSLTYEVIGIYTSSAVVDDRIASMMGSSLLSQNQIYTPLNTLKTMGYTDEQLKSSLLSEAVIQLKDPDNLDTFRAEAATKVTLTYGSLSANDQLYQQLAGPIESLGSTSTLLVWIVVIAGAAILSLITALTVNQRKNEIGILLSIGESKTKIIAQFIVEVLAIAAIAFTLSVFSGIQVGKMISEATLANYQTQETQTGPGQDRNFIGFPGQVSSDLEAADVVVTLNGLVVLEFFAAGLLISIVSVAIPALYVTRFNPKQILTNNG